jgi:Protein of unknown function (DUF2809)
MKFKRNYFYLTILLFFIEVCIAIFINDRLVRPLIGDVLVIALIYCFIQTFWNVRVTVAIAFVFGLACAIELAQYFNLVDRLGLQHNQAMATILGTTFDWKDIVAYAIGAVMVWWCEKRFGFRGASETM